MDTPDIMAMEKYKILINHSLYQIALLFHTIGALL